MSRLTDETRAMATKIEEILPLLILAEHKYREAGDVEGERRYAKAVASARDIIMKLREAKA